MPITEGAATADAISARRARTADNEVRCASMKDVATSVDELYPLQHLEIINPLVFTNAADFDDLKFERWLLESNAPRSAKIDPVSLFRYDSGTVVDMDGSYVTYSGGHLIAEQLPRSQLHHGKIAQDILDRASSGAAVNTPCLLVARYGETTWGHWVCEMLSKIVIAESLYPGRFGYVMPSKILNRGGGVSDQYIRAIWGSLYSYGVDGSRLILLPTNRAVTFDQLYDIGGVLSDGFHPAVLELMQSKVRKTKPSQKIRKVCFLRGKEEFRGVLNSDALEEHVRRRGYAVLDLPTLAFDEQVALFREAASIVAGLGSGLAGSIYARPGIELLTVAPACWYDGYFINILARKGAFHADIRGPSTRSYNGEISRSPFAIDTNRVGEGLDALMDDQIARRSNGAVTLGGRERARRLGTKVFQMMFGAESLAKCEAVGWYEPEAKHTWSRGGESSLTLCDCFLSHNDHWLEVEGISFVERAYLPFKPLGVTVNGYVCKDESVSGYARVIWLVPGRCIRSPQPIKLEFRHPVCPSPRSFGVSDDARSLGFGFTRLAWYETTSMQ